MGFFVHAHVFARGFACACTVTSSFITGGNRYVLGTGRTFPVVSAVNGFFVHAHVCLVLCTVLYAPSCVQCSVPVYDDDGSERLAVLPRRWLVDVGQSAQRGLARRSHLRPDCVQAQVLIL